MHILLHPQESGCQKKTFLCAVVAQMFREAIPTESEVRGQPLALGRPSPLRGLDTGRTQARPGKQAVRLCCLVAIFSEYNLEGEALKKASPTQVHSSSGGPRGEGLGLSRAHTK